MKSILGGISMPIFTIVAGVEHLIARKLRLTYNEVNILIYYLLIPLSWAAIIDYKIGYPALTILFTLLWSCIYWNTRKNFRYYCDVAFRMSQVFLLQFNRIGWNYVVSSVIVCVAVPIVVYITLLFFI